MCSSNSSYFRVLFFVCVFFLSPGAILQPTPSSTPLPYPLQCDTHSTGWNREVVGAWRGGGDDGTLEQVYNS